MSFHFSVNSMKISRFFKFPKMTLGIGSIDFMCKIYYQVKWFKTVLPIYHMGSLIALLKGFSWVITRSPAALVLNWKKTFFSCQTFPASARNHFSSLPSGPSLHSIFIVESFGILWNILKSFWNFLNLE